MVNAHSKLDIFLSLVLELDRLYQPTLLLHQVIFTSVEILHVFHKILTFISDWKQEDICQKSTHAALLCKLKYYIFILVYLLYLVRYLKFFFEN